MPRRHRDKEMQRVVDFAVVHGFIICKVVGHFKIKLGKVSLIMASSPSCPYAHINARKDVERIIKEHKENTHGNSIQSNSR